MRKKTGILLIVTLLLSSSVFSVFASEEVTLIDDGKVEAESALPEETQGEVTQEVNVSDEKVLKNLIAAVKQTKASSGRAIVRSGTIGTVNWTLDDTGALTFGGGTLPDDYIWSTLRTLVATSTKTVNFTAPITAGKSLLNMFERYTKLTTINGLENLDTSNVEDMRYMFAGCESLTSLDVSGFDTSNVKEMMEMFRGCQIITNLDVSNFDTRNVTNMMAMFDSCASLTSLDLSSFDTSNVTNMGGMFLYCMSLPNLDLSGFNTSKVVNFASMFQSCTSFTSLDITNFDTSRATSMAWMFGGCTNLASVDVTNFDTRNVTIMENMFRECTSLTKLDLSSFNTINATNMDIMFYAAPIKELKLGTTFRFKSSNHFLNQPTNDTEYTGKWELVSTYESFSQNQLTAYNGTKPGTYVWQPRRFYDLSYDSQGGSTVANQTVEVNQNATEPANPTKAGYTFAGWYKEAGLINQWNFTADVMPMNNVTLYAQWNINSYNVTYDTNGGSVVAGETVDYNSALTEPANPTKAGYTFDGWYKETGLTNKWNFMTDLMPTENITLYAKWKVAEYQITYNLDGGINSINNPSTYQEGTGVANFENPTKDGYKFLGWFESDTSNVEITNIGATEIGDKTLHARWEKIESSAKPGTSTPTAGGKGTAVKYSKAGVQTGDTINLIGIGIIFLASGGYVITRRKRRQNNG